MTEAVYCTDKKMPRVKAELTVTRGTWKENKENVIDRVKQGTHTYERVVECGP